MKTLSHLAQKRRWKKYLIVFFIAGIEGQMEYGYFTFLRHELEKAQLLLCADGILRNEDRESAILQLIRNGNPFQALIALYEYRFPRHSVMMEMLRPRCPVLLQEIIDCLLTKGNLTRLRYVLSDRRLQKYVDKALLL